MDKKLRYLIITKNILLTVLTGFLYLFFWYLPYKRGYTKALKKGTKAYMDDLELNEVDILKNLDIDDSEVYFR